MSAKRLQAGVNAIELMIVVVIAGILAAVATPSFFSLINSTRLTSAMTQLTSDLNRARSEAIKRNRRMLVCVRGTDTACGTGINWQNGWLVCYDEDQNGACDTAPGDGSNPNPITVRPAINARLTLTSSAAPIYFSPNGTQGTAAATLTLNGTWPGATAITANIAATGNISKTP
ncbi:MAG: GspH/FimT family pseudopilin [Nitrosomonadales bacterium]|nr:GspH/FimT family pseudopilin [Nitrosomonadales bacterium]